MTAMKGQAGPPRRVAKTEADFRRNLNRVRAVLDENRRPDAVAHAVFISLAPLDFLSAMDEVVADAETRLNRLRARDDAQRFQIAPTDFALVCRHGESRFVELVTEIRMMLVRLVRDYAPQAFYTIDQQDLIQVYNLGRHEAAIGQTLTRIDTALPRLCAAARGIRALTAGDIEWLMETLDRMPRDQFVRDFVAWQPVVRVRDDDAPRTVFHEYYISMRTLQETFLQGINLFTNLNLFKLLTTELDKRILACIRERAINPSRGTFNFNLETVLSAPFEQAGREGYLQNSVVELQVSDIFADYARFRLAREQMTAARAKFAVDGITPEMTDVLRCENLGCSYAKIRLDEAVDESPSFAADLRRMIEANVRVVGTRVEAHEPLREGMRMGIGRFQGFYVNKLVRDTPERERFLVT